MPRPAAQRSRGRSTQSKFLADASSLVSVVTSLQGQRGNSILDGKPVQQAILSFCLSLQALYPQNHASALPLLPEQAKEVVNQVIAIDLLPTLLVLLRSVTPSVLKRSGGNATGCSDPSCNDGACEPPEISSVLFMVSLTDNPAAWDQCKVVINHRPIYHYPQAFNMTTNLILSCGDTETQDMAYRKLLDSRLVGCRGISLPLK